MPFSSIDLTINALKADEHALKAIGGDKVLRNIENVRLCSCIRTGTKALNI